MQVNVHSLNDDDDDDDDDGTNHDYKCKCWVCNTQYTVYDILNYYSLGFVVNCVPLTILEYLI